jgi:hypothetical protein
MPVPTQTVEVQPREVQMWQFGSTRADADTPGELVCLFRPLTDSGLWDESAAVLRFRARDAAGREEEHARTIASDIRSAMLQALVPECPEVTRLEELTGLSLAGRTFQAFGEVLMGRLAQLGLLTQE